MPNLESLRFKNYAWPHNPSTYRQNLNKRIVTHEYPDIKSAENEELGVKPLVIRGSGAFYGEDAYEQYMELWKVYNENTPGKLIHPIWPSINATFHSLSVSQEPTPNYVQYEFEFIETADINVIQRLDNSSNNSSNDDKSNNKNKSSTTYTVKSGDTLSHIAKNKLGDASKWRDIAKANKKTIKNPNLIYPGQEIIIP